MALFNGILRSLSPGEIDYWLYSYERLILVENIVQKTMRSHRKNYYSISTDTDSINMLRYTHTSCNRASCNKITMQYSGFKKKKKRSFRFLPTAFHKGFYKDVCLYKECPWWGYSIPFIWWLECHGATLRKCHPDLCHFREWSVIYVRKFKN